MDIFAENNDSLVLSLTEINKTSLGLISSRVAKEVFDGNEDALETYIKAKGLSEVAEGIMSEIKKEAVREAENYASAGEVKLGCKFQVKNTPDSYSFEHNEEWAHIERQIQTLKARQKEIEQQMVEATKYSELIDKNGEVIPPAIVKRHGSSTLAITIPKQ